MNRKNQRFAVAPSSVNMKRSEFSYDYTHKTTCNFGDIVPFYVEEILPGDTFNVNTSMLSRMSTPLFPVMDDAWIDYMYFYVPNRLVYSHWAEFLGENKLSAWTQTRDFVLPNAEVVPEPGSLFDHMGLPTYGADSNAQACGLPGRPKIGTHVLPMRMYNLIYNEWFRSENVMDPVIVNTGDEVTGQEIESYQKLRKACKPFDYFTTALPAPQKGDAVDVPLVGSAPVIAGDVHGGSGVTMQMNTGGPLDAGIAGLSLVSIAGGDENRVTGYVPCDEGYAAEHYYYPSPSNLWANLDNVSATSINQLRQAFQMQRLLELQARTGTRYTEIIRASFGVISPDARLQRPEYLAGKTVRIQMQQVNQTSGTTDESPLGRVGAYSKTATAGHDFVYSFTEHGYIIGVMVARHALTYQQGIAQHWQRRTRYNFYWPTFAHIGEQPILAKNIFATGIFSEDEANLFNNSLLNENRVFGYGEAWIEYRVKPNEVTGAFRSTVDFNLDEWHYADYYQQPPVLSEGWLQANGTNVDRTLAVTSSLHDQLIFDIRVDVKAARVMPLYSTPGLIDHF